MRGGRSRIGLGPGALLAALLWGESAAYGAEPAIELSTPPAQAIEVPVALGVPGLVAEVRLRNALRDPAGARTFRPGAALTRRSDGLSVPAAWRRLDAGAGDGAVVAPGAELVLQLAAQVPEPGEYETWIDTGIPAAQGTSEAPDRRVHVVVTREAASLPADLLVGPKPIRQVDWPFVDGTRTALVRLQNTTAKPIEFKVPSVLSFERSGGGGDAVAAAQLPALDARDCPSPLAPGARCALALSVPRGLSPAQYAIDLGVGGVGGGWSQVTATVSVRRPLLFAFLATALGIAAGWFVQAWRASGRRAVTGLIEAATLRRRVDTALADAPDLDLAALRQLILDDVERAEARCRSGGDAAADLDRAAARLARLRAFASVERVFLKAPSAAQALLAASHAQLTQGAAAIPTEENRAAFEAGARALSCNLGAWSRFAEARNGASARISTLDGLLALPAEEAARVPVEAARGVLRTASSAALDALPAAPDGTELASRAAALAAARERSDDALATAVTAYARALRGRLDALTATVGIDDGARSRARSAAADLGRLDEAGDDDARALRLARLWPASAAPDAAESVQPAGFETLQPGAGAAPAPLPVLDLPAAAAFDLSPGRPLAALQRELRRNEIATNLIVLVGAGLTGAVLVAANDTWGSAVDIVTAILGGLGSRVVLGELASAAQAGTGA